MAEKREKRRLSAAKNKSLKRVKIPKTEEAKIDEKELWGRLNELNASFAKIKKKIKKTIKRQS